MNGHRFAVLVSSIALGTIIASCGGAASVAPSATAADRTAGPTPSGAAASTATAPLAWRVSDTSKATVSVREQLASFSFPSDAVLVAKGATGSFQIDPDGTFAGGSQITFSVSSLTSDSSQRDGFVKMTVLNARQFPTATFVPVNASGLSLPLAAAGTFSFTLTGKLTIHGVTKDVTFDVTATRAGSDLSVIATLVPAITFGDFGMPLPAAPGRVLSVVDEIKLVIDLVATGPTT